LINEEERKRKKNFLIARLKYAQLKFQTKLFVFFLTISFDELREKNNFRNQKIKNNKNKNFN